MTSVFAELLLWALLQVCSWAEMGIITNGDDSLGIREMIGLEGLKKRTT